MLTRIAMAWAPAALALLLAACGSKGELTLPTAQAPKPAPSSASPARPETAAPSATPATPAAPAPVTRP